MGRGKIQYHAALEIVSDRRQIGQSQCCRPRRRGPRRPFDDDQQVLCVILQMLVDQSNRLIEGRTFVKLDDDWRAAIVGCDIATLVLVQGDSEMYDFKSKTKFTSSEQIVLDCISVAIIAFLSLAPYRTSLGFYSDDHAMLSVFVFADDPSIAGLFSKMTAPYANIRPAYVLLLIFLYNLFGPSPLGYQMIIWLIYMMLAPMLYMVLRALRQPRLVCFASAVLFVCLPHASAARFWLSAIDAPLSAMFYFLGHRCRHGVDWHGRHGQHCPSAARQACILCLCVGCSVRQWHLSKRCYCVVFCRRGTAAKRDIGQNLDAPSIGHR
jgi:hypothetical protein